MAVTEQTLHSPSVLAAGRAGFWPGNAPNLRAWTFHEDHELNALNISFNQLHSRIEDRMQSMEDKLSKSLEMLGRATGIALGGAHCPSHSHGSSSGSGCACDAGYS